jgi:hypothetical protein
VGAHLTLHLTLLNEATPIKIQVAVTRWGAAPHFGLDFVLIEERGERLLSEYVKRLVGRDDPSRTQSHDGETGLYLSRTFVGAGVFGG